jgi:long-chain acyl-CoA synthetase
LQKLGLAAGDRVLLLSENRREWLLADLAIQLVGGVVVPAHASASSQQIAHQLSDCGARLALVSGGDPLAKLKQTQESLPDALQVVAFDRVGQKYGGLPLPCWKDHIPARLSETDRTKLLSWFEQHVAGETLATILYTSGTSGDPKGVMLTQENLAFNAQATFRATGESADDLKLGFLPLSHIFARTCDFYVWIACGNRLALARSRESVLEDCAAVHPTWINGVPYFYDKLRKEIGDDPKSAERLQKILGGQIRSCQCGGAAVSRTTYDFFWDSGLPLFPGYGLTEASPVISVSSPRHVCWGAVGRPLPGVDVKVAEDGEIMTRGPHVMRGYWRNETATRQSIREGWLHTGDAGRLDEDGFLWIEGRKKEMIVLSTGRNLSPMNLETLLLQDPAIQQVFVTGDGRPFPVALIVPDWERLSSDTNAAMSESNCDIQATAARQNPATLGRRIDALMVAVADYERICRFAVLPRPLDVQHGELTSKGSLRREQIARNWAAEIDRLYRDPAEQAVPSASNLDTDGRSARIHADS